MYSINKEKETHYLLPFHRLHQLLVIEMRILATRLNLLRKLILIPADTNNKIRAIKIDSAFRSARMHIYSCMLTRVYAWASERAWRNRAAAAEYRNSLKARLKIQTLPQEVWHAPRQWLEDIPSLSRTWITRGYVPWRYVFTIYHRCKMQILKIMRRAKDWCHKIKDLRNWKWKKVILEQRWSQSRI